MDERLLDKSWRLSHLYSIKDKDQNTIQFKPNRAQADFESRRANRNIILKSRQLGFSTYEAIDTLDDALFSRNFDGIMILHEQKMAVDVFRNKVYFAWENFPEFLKELYSVDAKSANKLIFNFGDKTFSTISVGATGRSGTLNRIHVSEFAKMCKKYPDNAREVISGAIPSLTPGGRIDIESTAEGNYGIFYDMFWEAWNRKREPYEKEYKAHFYNWTWDDHQINNIRTCIPVSDMDRSNEFANYKKLHNLTDAQITYYYLQWLSLNKNWDLLRQEYPFTPEEAFIGSGTSMFDQSLLDKMKLRTRSGVCDGDWIFYEPYIDGHHYALGVDVAQGVGQDSSTIVILDFSENRTKLVAEYASNKIAPDILAYEVKRGAVKYGHAIAAVERNNHGHTTLATLKNIYQNIFTEIKHDHIADAFTEKLGWQTSGSSKPKMLYELKEAINQDLIEIPSPYILDELRTYDKEDLSITKFNPDQTKHWDRLMALAICYQMRAFAFDDDIEITTNTNDKY